MYDNTLFAYAHDYPCRVSADFSIVMSFLRPLAPYIERLR